MNLSVTYYKCFYVDFDWITSKNYGKWSEILEKLFQKWTIIEYVRVYHTLASMKDCLLGVLKSLSKAEFIEFFFWTGWQHLSMDQEFVI